MATSKPAAKKTAEPTTKHGIKYSAIKNDAKFEYRLPTGQGFIGKVTSVSSSNGKPTWITLSHKVDAKAKASPVIAHTVRPGSLTRKV